jgi:hypothetical protein
MSEIVIDSHVHIHDCFSLEYLLDMAYANMSAVSNSADSIFCLLLTESDGSRVFDAISHDSEHPSLNFRNWLLVSVGESGAVRAEHAGGAQIFIFSGRQVVTQENVELLGLLTSASIKDGMPLQVTADVIREAGGMVVVPWGFGKWLGRRGEAVTRMLASEAPLVDFVGDNGGRPEFGWEPKIFKLATSLGIRILPGSDPFPFRGQEIKVGRASIALTGDFDSLNPVASLRRILHNEWRGVRMFRAPPSAGDFLFQQLRMLSKKYYAEMPLNA